MRYVEKFRQFESSRGFTRSRSGEKYVQYFKYKIVGEEPISEIENYKSHNRLRVFYEKGVECVKCGIIGTKIIKGEDAKGNIHTDVTTDDYYPLTVDHIVPKSKGGSDRIDNLQPMCCLCNWEKGNGEKGYSGREGIKKYPSGYTSDPKSKPKVGDFVWRKSGKKFVPFGIVSEILINDKHPKKALSIKIDGKLDSVYDINQFIVGENPW